MLIPNWQRDREKGNLLRSGGTCLPVVLVALLAGCKFYQVPPPEPVTLENIIAMSQEDRTPEEIIAEIEKSRTLYKLETADILKLTEGGVDPKVVDYMLETHRRALESRYRYRYPYYYDPWWYGPPYYYW